MTFKNFILVTAFVLPVMFMFSCSGKQSKSNVKNDSIPSQVLSADEISTVSGIGLVEPESQIVDLALNNSGTISRVYQSSGTKVKKGDIILSLDHKDDQLNLQETQAQRTTAQITEQLNQANVQETQNRLNDAISTLNQTKKLFEKGAVTRQELDNDELNVKVLKIQLEQNQLSVQQAKSQINQSNVSIAKAQNTLEDDVLRAPSDGVVLQVLVPEFSNVQANQNLVEFAPDGPTVVRCEIDEMFANYIQPGQKVDICNVGFSKVIATGTIQKASPFLKQKSLLSDNSTDQQDRRVREVVILLNDAQGLLYNSRVDCTIHLK